MQVPVPLDVIPIWLLFVLTLGLSLVSIDAGYRVGAVRRVAKQHEDEPPVGAMVAAMLGLLAFMLAFTFGLAATRYDARRQLVLDEADAIGTAWLRAGMLPEHGDEIRGLLREYTDVQIRAGDDPRRFAESRRQSEAIHLRLWSHATDIARRNPGSTIVPLFVAPLNDVMDFHAKRVTAATQHRIPLPIWGALYLVAVLSLAVMGYHNGVVSKSRSLAMLAVAIAFTAVLWLIADLDRPHEGLLLVSQQPMIDLRESMDSARTTTRPSQE